MARVFIVVLSVTLSACVDGGIRFVGDSELSSDPLMDQDTEPVRDLDMAEADPAADEQVSEYPDGDLSEDESVDQADLEPDAPVSCFVGSACTSDDQCSCVPSGEGQCLTELAGLVVFPGGYCSAACTSHEDCGDRSRCVEITTGMMVCLKVCTTSTECRMEEGYGCPIIVDADISYCLPSG
jgi:hypothetical protein